MYIIPKFHGISALQVSHACGPCGQPRQFNIPRPKTESFLCSLLFFGFFCFSFLSVLWGLSLGFSFAFDAWSFFFGLSSLVQPREFHWIWPRSHCLRCTMPIESNIVHFWQCSVLNKIIQFEDQQMFGTNNGWFILFIQFILKNIEKNKLFFGRAFKVAMSSPEPNYPISHHRPKWMTPEVWVRYSWISLRGPQKIQYIHSRFPKWRIFHWENKK